MPRAVFHFEGRKLRALASSPDVTIYFTAHAEQRMRERGVSRIDIQSILRTGTVAEVQGDGRWLAQGRDQDGRTIRVVVVAEEREIEITIITVIAD